MRKLTILIITIATLAGCKKEKKQPYVPGDVLVGIKDEVLIDSTFRTLSSFHLYIKSINGFTYVVSQPANMLDSIAMHINTKPYIDSNWKASIAYHANWNQPVYFSHFIDMDATRQADWLATARQLDLTEVPAISKSVHLRVPEGTEEYWVNQLSHHPMVSWAELNNIVEIDLH